MFLVRNFLQEKTILRTVWLIPLCKNVRFYFHIYMSCNYARGSFFFFFHIKYNYNSCLLAKELWWHELQSLVLPSEGSERAGKIWSRKLFVKLIVKNQQVQSAFVWVEFIMNLCLKCFCNEVFFFFLILHLA